MLNSLKAVCDCSESELLFNSIPVSQNQIQLSRLTSSFKNTNTATAKVLSNRVPPQTSGWHPSGYIHLSDCQWAKHGDTCHTCEYARVCLTSFSSLDCEWEGPCRCLHAFPFFVTEPLGVFTPIVCLLWSKSVDDFFLICSFFPPVVWFVFTQRKMELNSKWTNMHHRRPHLSIQSADWPDVSGTGVTKVKTGRRCCLLDYWRKLRISVNFAASC